MKLTTNIRLILIGLFVMTRVFIWVFRPIEFTDVVHNFMAYAHLWDSGVKPYLEQWYEYPPGTIPLFYLPHLVDKTTLNTPWHLNYSTAYRGLMLITDVLLFWFIWKALVMMKVKRRIFITAIVYYCLTTAKAHHFMYDKIDWLFAAVSLVGVAAPLLIRQEVKERIVFWLGFLAAVAVKLINFPLGIVYATGQRSKPKITLVGMAVAFALTLAVPILYYRSSLSVMFVYHQQRGLQVESVPAVFSATVNKFTQSEEFVEVYKNYDIAGPVSNKIKLAFDFIFPVSLIGVIGFGVARAWKVKKIQQRVTSDLYLTVLYILVFMLTSKVLSTPFLLWHIPFLAVYPFKSDSLQRKLLIGSFVMIAISMTRIPDIKWGLINLHLIIGLTRSGIIGWMTLVWYRHRRNLVTVGK